MVKKIDEYEYDDSDFEEPTEVSRKPSTKKSADKAGLSLTALGRISLTTGLQVKLGIDPTKRDKLTYVEVRAHKDKTGDNKYIFSLRFYDDHDETQGPGHTVYKPDRKGKSGITNNTSYIEFARYLKKKGLIESVSKARKELTSGPIDIVPNGIKPNRILIINLKSRFKK